MTKPLGTLLVCACLVAPPAGAATKHRAADPDSHVRTSNVRIAEVLDFALTRSPSFQDLVATLDFLDRVVYVEEGQCRSREARACLNLTAGASAIVVRIDPRQPIRAVVAQLAHELYHAVEIAREPDVAGAAALNALYERIGERRCFDEGESCWETRAAVAFEALVVRQVSAAKTAKTAKTAKRP